MVMSMTRKQDVKKQKRKSVVGKFLRGLEKVGNTFRRITRRLLSSRFFRAREHRQLISLSELEKLGYTSPITQSEAAFLRSTSPTSFEDMLRSTTPIQPTTMYMISTLRDYEKLIIEIERSKKKEQERKTEEELEKIEIEQREEKKELANVFYDSIDDVLIETLTPEELDMLIALLVDAMRGRRTKIPLDWLPPEKQAVVQAWLLTNWGRYNPLNWYAVTLTRSVANGLAKLYPNMRFRIYVQICWRRPDAPDRYQFTQSGDVICITPYVDTILGSELPLLLDPAYLSDFLTRSPSYESFADDLGSASMIRVWVKPETD